MTYTEKAKQLGITVERLKQLSYEYLQNEGYDDFGNEYDTLDDFIASKKINMFTMEKEIEPRDY